MFKLKKNNYCFFVNKKIFVFYIKDFIKKLSLHCVLFKTRKRKLNLAEKVIRCDYKYVLLPRRMKPTKRDKIYLSWDKLIPKDSYILCLRLN